MPELSQLWDIIIGSYVIIILLSLFIGFMIAYLVVSDFWKGEL